ncbi:Sec-independent protein translocase protein TatB [Aeromonas bivalvium]|uniref:Sec-independent protein translocase protein TatB n=1 Tax=Aeromonas bivalvium TaxID=440079 RepID=UPI000DCF94E3|nr:Sec-independent protein translocase protein TatB [Aeromonas bivalvium]
MFDIGFWELVLVGIVGLLVLGPERLPVAIRTVSGWIRAVRSTANAVKSELAQELKLQELHNDLKKAEQLQMQNLSPELQESIEKLKAAADSVTHPYARPSSPDAPIHEPDAVPEPENRILPEGVARSQPVERAEPAATASPDRKGEVKS